MVWIGAGAIADKNVLRDHSVVDHVAGQVTVDLNFTGGNSFDLAKEEVEDGVVPPGEPPLVQGHWAEVDDLRQCAVGAGKYKSGKCCKRNREDNQSHNQPTETFTF